MSLGWGIAATGRIARAVGEVVRESSQMHVAAVGSRDAGRAAALAGELGAPASYGSYQDLVTDPAVQAVYVATPHAQHAAVVDAALRAGRAVLCEKPLTASLAETERLVALAAETRCFLMEAMWMRFNPLVRALVDVVREGRLGEVRSVRASFGFAAPFNPGGRLWDPSLGGGALLDLGVYTVDLARLLLGDPATVSARGSVGSTGVDTESALSLSWPSGAVAVLEQSIVSRLPGTATVVGSRGWAELSPTFHAPTRLVVETDGHEQVEQLLTDRRAGFVGELEEVASCLSAGRSQSEVMPLAESVATMRVLDEARRQVGG